MDGLTAALARVEQIQARIAALAPAAPARSGSSFAQQLTAASSSSPPTGPVSSPTTPPAESAAWNRSLALGGRGRLNGDGVPAELAQYGNGKVPESALTAIGPGSRDRLWAPAADAFSRMAAAAARDGVTIGVTDSYRSYGAQVDVARRKGLYSEGGLAAEPGTSNHGYGRSVDLALDNDAQAWMRANGSTYGFVEDTPREAWHWTFSPPG